jgi:hypothetical protein
VAAGRSYIEAGARVVLVDPARLQALARAQSAVAGTGPAAPSARTSGRIGAARAVEVEDLLGALSPGFRPPEAWRALTSALRDHSKLEPAPVAPSMDSAMRPYQRLGAAWLWHLHRLGLGGVLADEMGLGKTL